MVSLQDEYIVVWVIEETPRKELMGSGYSKESGYLRKRWIIHIVKYILNSFRKKWSL